MRRCPPTGRLIALVVAAFLSHIAASHSQDNWQPPPPAGNDGFDWIQLKSGEWLKGRIKSFLDDKLEFDSEELDFHTFKWKDIRMVRSPRLLSVRFDTRGTQDGSLLVTTNQVRVVSATATNIYPRAELLAFAPTGNREINKWSGKLSTGLSFRAGNVDETDITTSITLQRRTPTTRLALSYLGSYSVVNDLQTENNQRAALTFDYYLSRRLFVRAADLEYYRDPIANTKRRLTLGAGVGYTLFDTKRFDWDVTAGPAFQHTVFESVEAGQSDSQKSGALVLGTTFDLELSKRLDFLVSYRGQYTGQRNDNNAQHVVATLEYEIHKRLTLDLSFIWDRVANPPVQSNGQAPSPDDTQLILGLGIEF